MVNLKKSFQIVGITANFPYLNFSLAAIAFSLIWGGFFIYSRFFSGSNLSITDLCLNSNLHFILINLIKKSVSSGETPITTNDLKIDFKLIVINNAFRDMQVKYR